METKEVTLSVWEAIKLAQAVNNSDAAGPVGTQKAFHRLSDLAELSDAEKAAAQLQEIRYADGRASYVWGHEVELPRAFTPTMLQVARAVVTQPPAGVFTVRDGKGRRGLLEKLGASAEDLAALFGEEGGE